MAKVLINEENLTNIANAIREKNGETTTYKPGDMAGAITDLPIGGDTSSEDELVMGTTTRYYNNRITKVAPYGLSNKAYVESIDLPLCTEFGNYALTANPNLKEVNLPLLNKVGQYAFYDCPSLISIDLPNVLELPLYSFSICRGLKSVNLPSVTKLSGYAFQSCEALTSVNIPACTTINDYAFINCGSLETIDLPNVKIIGSDCFRICKKLKTINLPRCETVNSGAFQTCESLEYLELPLVTKFNSSYILSGCKSLYFLDIPSCTDLGNSSMASNDTFRNCPNLLFLDLPLVQSIAKRVFYGSNVSTIVLHSNTVCTIQAVDTFSSSPIEEGTGYVYVPMSLLESYKTATNWVTYADQIIGINDYVYTTLNETYTPTYNGETEVSTWDLINLERNTIATIDPTTGIVTTTGTGNVLIRALDVDGNILYVSYLTIEEVTS